MSNHGAIGALMATIVIAAAQTVAAQDPLIAARDLYRAAAYEDALARLNNLRGSARGGDESRFIEQYRAFCLLALGRTSEAERAIEAVVTAAPSYHPTDADESPRVRSAFRQVRQRVLPGIIQQLYEQAKAAFDQHDLAAARPGFQQVLDLLDDPDLSGVPKDPHLSELRTLATGFRDLSVAPASPSPLPTVPPLQPREPAQRPFPGRIYSVEDTNVSPPVVMRESWTALADVFAVRVGAVQIVIDETGAVESATMTIPVNPVYDRLAMSTAKSWRYRPAMLDGTPVKFRKVIVLDRKQTR